RGTRRVGRVGGRKTEGRTGDGVRPSGSDRVPECSTLCSSSGGPPLAEGSVNRERWRQTRRVRHHREVRMRLNPPSIVIFLISFVLALLALVTKLGFVPVPRYLPHQEFWLATTAYLVLMVGNLVRGV